MIQVMRRLRARRTTGDGTARDAGAVAVEAALITPILIALVFGMIEFSLLLRDNVATTSLVRTGARIASAEPRVGSAASCKNEATVPSCFAQDASDAIERAGSALPKNSIDYIRVYLANPKGYPSQSSAWSSDTTSTFDVTCSAYCLQYKWVDGSGTTPGRFTYQAGSWDPTSINACINDANAMAVGVYMKVTHAALTGLFFKDFTIEDHAVMKFEPKTAETCK